MEGIRARLARLGGAMGVAGAVGVVAALVMAVPAGAHVSGNVGHLWAHVRAKADVRYWTRTRADARYWTRSQADGRFARAGSAYTKGESDALFEPLDSAYTKAETDGLFEPLDSAYTKAEAGGLFEPLDSAYTKGEADGLFEPLDSAYTKAESDARYPAAASLPMLWADRDGNPATIVATSVASQDVASVTVAAPAAGCLLLHGAVEVDNDSVGNKVLGVRLTQGGSVVTGASWASQFTGDGTNPDERQVLAASAALDVAAGTTTFTLQVAPTSGTATFSYNSQSLTAVWHPAARCTVTVQP